MPLLHEGSCPAIWASLEGIRLIKVVVCSDWVAGTGFAHRLSQLTW